MASWRYTDDNADHLSRENRDEREMAVIVITGLIVLLALVHWGPELIDAATRLLGA